MAKRRREKTDEEIDFKIPKFDEEKFLERERRNIKTTFLSFLFGFIIALISFGFWHLLNKSSLRWELILLFGLFSGSWLKYLFIKLKINLDDFGRKGWFTSYTIYFFTWLTVLIILSNPPFYDDTPPNISAVALPEKQEIGGTVKIVAHIIDNAGIEKKGINFTLIYPNGNKSHPDFMFENNILSYTYYNPNNIMGEYGFVITAVDINNHKKVVSKNFTYSNSTIRLASPAGAETKPGPVVTYGTTIKFDVDTTVTRVYYRVDDGMEINVSKPRDSDFYETYPKFQGWPSGNKNVTVKVYADVIHYFKNLNKQFKNTVVDSATYYFQLTGEGIGEEKPPEIRLPVYRPIATPGFEILTFAVALIMVALILKHTWKQQQKKKAKK